MNPSEREAMLSGTDASHRSCRSARHMGHGPTEKLGLALLQCAAHVETGPMEKATRCLARATGPSAAAGDGPRKRLAVAMDCLARRFLRPVPAITDALIDPSAYLDRRSVRAARRGFFELSPFPKVEFDTHDLCREIGAFGGTGELHLLLDRCVGQRARGIIEAVENESFVHVFGMSGQVNQPCQWIQLLHELRRRPEGPPRVVLLTVVHDHGEFLAKMAELVSDEAEELGMEFQFHGVVGQLEDLDFSNLHNVLEIKSGEALAVSCTLQLHRLLVADDDVTYSSRSAHLNQLASIAQLQHMAASSCPPSSCGASVQCKDDDDSYRSPGTPLAFVSPPASTPHLQTPAPLASFLSAVRSLSPKIVVVAEQDAHHNGVSFRKRFCEALHHYAAVFDSLDAAAATSAASHLWPPDERAQVERVVVGEEIKGVLLWDGAHRRERHDRLRQWAAHMEMAGFTGVPLSYIAIKKGNDVLRWRGLRRCENKECGGCVLLCWSSRPLYSISAWRPAAIRGSESDSERSDYMSVPSQMIDNSGT